MKNATGEHLQLLLLLLPLKGSPSVVHVTRVAPIMAPPAAAQRQKEGLRCMQQKLGKGGSLWLVRPGGCDSSVAFLQDG